MGGQSKLLAGERAKPRRKKRADGARNRQRLIEAAKEAFTEQGPHISLEAVAKRAGVGIGTLYRHFQNRDALIEAVSRHDVEALAGAASRLLEELQPGEALRCWMRLYVDFIAANKILALAVSASFGISSGQYRSSVAQITDNPVLGSTSDVYRSAVTLFTEAAALLLDRATSAGDVRPGLDARDLMRALGGFTVTYGDEVEGWEESALRLIDVLIDGLTASRPAADKECR